MRLAARFPQLRWHNGAENPVTDSYGLYDRVDIAYVAGGRAGLRAHFPQIAQLLAGGRVATGNWEIPLGLLHLLGVGSPARLEDDTYYLRLAVQDGALVWHFSGSRGSEKIIPVIFKERNHMTSNGPTIAPGVIMNSIQLTAWPVSLAIPELQFTFTQLPHADMWQQEQALLAGVVRQCPPSETFAVDRYMSIMYYLDSQRKHRLLLALNNRANVQFIQALKQGKQGKAGAIILYALATDEPLEGPATPAGVYRVRLVLPNTSASPYLDLATPDMQRVAAWGAASHPLQPLETNIPFENTDYSSIGTGFNLPLHSGFAGVEVEHFFQAAQQHSFPFVFKVSGIFNDAAVKAIKSAYPDIADLLTKDYVSRNFPIGRDWARGRMGIRVP